MSETILGAGSRIKHPQFGKGVVVQIRSDAYEITFIEHGTRVYGSLTTFNILFKDKEDQFVGDKGV
jgi:hypothetical protein